MSLTIAEKLKPGPFPDALIVNMTRSHERLFLAPLDRPGPNRRDAVMIGAEQRSLGAGLTFVADLPRVVAVVRWLDQDPTSRHWTRILTLDSETPGRDLLTLVRDSEMELTLSFEHWTSGMVRKHREVELDSEEKITALRDWLHQFWSVGLPDVVRRRADESATEFAARRAATIREES